MHVRTISPSELDQFVAIGPHALGVEGFTQYIRESWDQGISQPNRCFVVEDNGRLIGRIVYRGQGREVNFTGLYLPWEADYLNAGTRLFEESLAHLRQDGDTAVEAVVRDSWDYTSQARALMKHLGWPLIQSKIRYIWQRGEATPPHTTRLAYRTLTQIGETAFTDLIRRASVGTLDRLDQLDMSSMGPEKHAQNYVHLLKTQFEHVPGWWLAADTDTGDVVGHVVGVPFNLHQHEGAIGYIGVVPEHRGKGYIGDLLNEIAAVMVQDGITTIIGDTDESNVPMQRAFERCGYERTDTTWIYRTEL